MTSACDCMTFYKLDLHHFATEPRLKNVLNDDEWMGLRESAVGYLRGVKESRMWLRRVGHVLTVASRTPGLLGNHVVQLFV
jgi:hypothetical protein